MKKQKLILAMYIGVIALAVASVSMSVAWFASSANLRINSINITIDTDRSLDISTSKDDGYTDRINHTELDPSGVFVPLTSAHSSLWTSQKKDSPIFYDESNASEVEHFEAYRPASYGYFSQKFYLLADDDLWITIDAEKTFIHANEEYNTAYAKKLYKHYQRSQDPHDAYYKSFSEDELKQKLDDIVKAMRFSLLIKDGEEYSYTIIDPYYEEETVLGGTLDNAFDQYFDYYLKEGTVDDFYERVYGEYVGTPAYDDPLDQDSAFNNPDELPSAFNARHKNGVKRFNETRSKEENGFEFKVEEAIKLEDFNNKFVPFHFPVYRDTPKEVVVSIYIEGWDKDSVNYTMGAAFISDFTFKIEREK